MKRTLAYKLTEASMAEVTSIHALGPPVEAVNDAVAVTFGPSLASSPARLATEIWTSIPPSRVTEADPVPLASALLSNCRNLVVLVALRVTSR